MTVRLSRIVRAVEGLGMPSFPDLCGPDEVADAVLAWRAGHPDRLDVDPSTLISDRGLKRLLHLAYHASQLPDEGRFPRFRLVNSMRREGTRITTFTPCIPLSSPGDLHRIASICHDQGHALSIYEKEGALSCDGITHTGPLGDDLHPGRPEILHAAGGMPPIIDVKGPGFLIARGAGHVGIELRGGRAQVLSPVSLIPPFGALLDRFGEACAGALIPDPNDPSRFIHGGAARCISDIASSLLRDLLRRMVDARHGGMVVIIPGQSYLVAPPLSIRFGVADLDLGGQIGDFFMTCVENESTADRMRDWQAGRARLISGIAALVGFSLVDGCVVLDEMLNTLGFGAEITVRDEAARLGMPFSSFKRRESFAYDDFMRAIGGTRHRSAARLCATVPGAIAFVVSQDGELRVFCNDAVQAFGFGPMDTE